MPVEEFACSAMGMAISGQCQVRRVELRFTANNAARPFATTTAMGGSIWRWVRTAPRQSFITMKLLILACACASLARPAILKQLEPSFDSATANGWAQPEKFMQAPDIGRRTARFRL